MRNAKSLIADRFWRTFPDFEGYNHISIFRLCLLICCFAVAFATLRFAPFVGVFLLSCLPLAVILAYLRRPVSRLKVAKLILALIPIYIASEGPAIGLAYLIYSRLPSNPEWPYTVVGIVYPQSALSDETTIGKAMMDYTDQWVAAAGG